MVQDKEEIIHTICECDKNYSKKKFKYEYMKKQNILVSRLKYLLNFRGSCLNPVNAREAVILIARPVFCRNESQCGIDLIIGDTLQLFDFILYISDF